MKKETLYLIGGSGFIGKNLVRCLSPFYGITVFDKYIDTQFFSNYPQVQTCRLDLVIDKVPTNYPVPEFIINLASVVTAERITPTVVEIDSTKKEEQKDENLQIITSPMVGTFYSSDAPDKPAYVKVGDKINKGQVVCIVEAMKLMNEIESEFDGEVVEVCAKNEEMVEYGAPLFKIKALK